MNSTTKRTPPQSVDQRFLAFAEHTLRVEYLPKIIEAVSRLSDEELWHRPSSAANSVGNLLLHLAGNVRQHLIAGVGERHPDQRNRPLEFAARGGIGKEYLLSELGDTVNEACAVLSTLDTQRLLAEREIQNKRVALLDDIYHVVEHFAYHAGQIIYLVKALKDRGFDWYQHLDR